MAAEDEIWRPGYDGPAPVSSGIALERFDSGRRRRATPDRRSWRFATAVGAVVAVSVAAVAVVGSWVSGSDPQGAVVASVADDTVDGAVVDGDGDDGLEFSSPAIAEFADSTPLRLLDDPATPFAGADQRRLPDVLVPRWTIELAPLVADGGANATTWVEAVDSRYVVVGVGDARALTGPAAVHVLDAPTGRKLWVVQVDTRIDQVDFVAAIGDVLVLTLGTEIVAFDLKSGSQLWDDRLAKVDGSIDEIAPLQGTELLVRSSPDPQDPISMVDPTTGTVLGGWIGEVLGSDGLGRWYVLRGGKIFEFDLAPDSNAGSGFLIDGELVGTVDAERSRDVAVIGGSLVTTLDEQLAIGPLEIDGERATGPGGLTPLTTDFGTPDGLVRVSGSVPLGGSGFAIVGGGTISGAEVLDGSIRFAWQRRGTVTASYATERGVALLVGTDGGAAQTLVDAATGDTIATLTMSPGLFQALEVTGNGIVTRRTSGDGLRIAGLDLDGNELWALDGAEPVSVGDRIVVRSTPQADGSFEVAAYGEPR